MKFGCCTSADNYDLLVENGYDRIILSGVELSAMGEQDFKRLRSTLENGAVECRALNSFCSPELVLCGNGYSYKTVEAYTKALAGRAAELGVRYIGVGSPNSRSIPTGYPHDAAVSQFELSIAGMCRICEEYDIDVLVEPVCTLECNFINTTDEAVALVKGLALGNLNIVFDTFHAFMMGEDDMPLRRAMEYVKLVHVAQHIDGRRHYLRSEGVDEYRAYLQTLAECGYDGEVSVEAFVGEPEAELAGSLSIMTSLCSHAG